MSTLPPRDLVEQDWALEQGIESDTTELYRLRWEATNPNEPGSFTFEAYAEARSAVGRKISKTQIRDTARAYEVWMADAEANDGEAVYTISQHADMMRFSAARRAEAIETAEKVAATTGERPDPVKILKAPKPTLEVDEALGAPESASEPAPVLAPVPDLPEPSEALPEASGEELDEPDVTEKLTGLLERVISDLELVHELLGESYDPTSLALLVREAAGLAVNAEMEVKKAAMARTPITEVESA